jgi:hypothetical protein
MSPNLALIHRWCTEHSAGKVECIADAPFCVRSSTVRLWGMKRRAGNVVTTPGFDPLQTKLLNSRTLLLASEAPPSRVPTKRNHWGGIILNSLPDWAEPVRKDALLIMPGF